MYIQNQDYQVKDYENDVAYEYYILISLYHCVVSQRDSTRLGYSQQHTAPAGSPESHSLLGVTSPLYPDLLIPDNCYP